MKSLPVDQQPASRSPAVPAAVGFAAGIMLDRFVLSFSWTAWTLLSLVAIGGSILAGRRSQFRHAVVGLLGLCVCLGGLRHHAFWSLKPPGNIAQFLTEEPRLARVQGQVVSPPSVRLPSTEKFASAYPQSEITVFTMQCWSIRDGDRSISVKGRVEVRVAGSLPAVRVGDELDVLGWLESPKPIANPQDFDFAEHLRKQRIDGLLGTRHVDAVRKLSTRSSFDGRQMLDEFRSRSEKLFQEHLDDNHVAIASALLLGTRSALPEELKRDFAESGLSHVLALSGLHVGILAMFVWGVCRCLLLSSRMTIFIILLAVFGLALISGGRPPIVRATVFLTILSLGRLASRQSAPANVLALSSIVILAWNPSNLFDTGTQLSFLAVAGILMTANWRTTLEDDIPLGPDESLSESRLAKFVRAGLRWWRQYWLVILGIWLMTVPLTAARFHIVSPIGLALNIVLFPVVIVVLWLGFSLLFLGTLAPSLAPIVALPFGAGLSFFLESVQWGAELPFGHFDVAGPPDWWLLGYYGIFAGLYFFRKRISRPWFLGTILILLWSAIGLAATARPDSPDGLRVTFMAVGPGSAVLVEFPEGKTMLYDAGALDDGERAFRVIRRTLWSRGIKRLDALVLSHGDFDHINAVPLLAESVPIGTVFVARSFLASSREVVQYVVESLAEAGISIRAIGASDRLRFDPLVETHVMHPDPKVGYAHNNANSVVIRLIYAERQLLLMGDVERGGLLDLIKEPIQPIDVLQSPHHGSPTANTLDLARWAKPRIVVVNGGFVAGRTEQLQSLYGRSVRLLTTYENGAVAISITPNGGILVDPMHP